MRNFINIMRINANITLLFKSYFLTLASFSLVLIFLNQYWSVIKLYFYLSPILWFFMVF